MKSRRQAILPVSFELLAGLIKGTVRDEYFIDFNTTQQPGKIQAVRVRIGLATIEKPDQKMRVDLADHPLYPELKEYVESNQ